MSNARRALTAGLATIGVALVVLVPMAQAQGPLVPGQVKSEALAESFWHTGCAHVGVSELTAAVPLETPTMSAIFGYALAGTCRVQIAPATIAKAAALATRNQLSHYNNFSSAAKRKMAPRIARRKDELLACAVLVHEYGHLAGYYNPVGYTNPVTGEVDHHHSPDPRNVMYPSASPDNMPGGCVKTFPR